MIDHLLNLNRTPFSNMPCLDRPKIVNLGEGLANVCAPRLNLLTGTFWLLGYI